MIRRNAINQQLRDIVIITKIIGSIITGDLLIFLVARTIDMGGLSDTFVQHVSQMLVRPVFQSSPIHWCFVLHAIDFVVFVVTGDIK